jgi:hypothetical protein
MAGNSGPLATSARTVQSRLCPAPTGQDLDFEHQVRNTLRSEPVCTRDSPRYRPRYAATAARNTRSSPATTARFETEEVVIPHGASPSVRTPPPSARQISEPEIEAGGDEPGRILAVLVICRHRLAVSFLLQENAVNAGRTKPIRTLWNLRVGFAICDPLCVSHTKSVAAVPLIFTVIGGSGRRISSVVPDYRQHRRQALPVLIGC